MEDISTKNFFVCLKGSILSLSLCNVVSTLPNFDVFVVDMSELCEIEGYLLYKKPLKWTSYYCCVYNGTFSCFKNQRSSLPELQCLLSNCRVRFYLLNFNSSFWWDDFRTKIENLNA